MNNYYVYNMYSNVLSDANSDNVWDMMYSVTAFMSLLSYTSTDLQRLKSCTLLYI